jgi:hypothetical protein
MSASGLICSVALLVALHGAVAAQVCTPFGNPPRAMVPDVTPLTCVGGTMMPTWTDADGTARRACLYDNPAATPAKPLPLIVYLHPSLFSADTLTTVTNVLSFQQTADLTGDPTRPGFIVVAPAGRATTHYYPVPDDQGLGWDNWYRQLEKRGRDVVAGGVTYRQNVDAAAIDHYIDAVVATGKVDRRRIYIMGWSNGAAMAVLYGLSRTRIAAAAPYTAPNPFEAFNDPCPQEPTARRPRTNGQLRVANRRLPIFHLHNACDIAGICPNGQLMLAQMLALRARITDVIIDGAQNEVPMCDAGCGTNPRGDMNPLDNPRGFTEGSQNHTRWPTEWTASMLEFFRQHRGRGR